MLYKKEENLVSSINLRVTIPRNYIRKPDIKMRT